MNARPPLTFEEPDRDPDPDGEAFEKAVKARYERPNRPWLVQPAPVYFEMFNEAPSPQRVPLAIHLDLLIAMDHVRCARTEETWLAAVEKQLEFIAVGMPRLGAAEPLHLEPLTDEDIAATVAERERELEARKIAREAVAKVKARMGTRWPA